MSLVTVLVLPYTVKLPYIVVLPEILTLPSIFVLLDTASAPSKLVLPLATTVLV